MTERAMRAWSVVRPGPVERAEEASLRFAFVEKPMPVPADDELLVRVTACGVCRTDLHVVEGDLPVRRAGVTPGHEVVGVVARAAGGFAVGDRVGVAWLRRTDGTCPYCLRGARTCARPPGGGYAEYTTVPGAFAHRLPDGRDDVSAAPLLCAGVIGHRASRRADGSGCTGSAAAPSCGHRTRTSRRPSLWTARSCSHRSAIWYRWRCVALPGAERRDPPDRHTPAALREATRSVTSNTREDAREFLALAARYGVRATTHTCPLSRADQALRDLKAGRFDGAAVLVR